MSGTTYIGADGLVHLVAANVLRDAHFPIRGGARTTLLGAARTNLCLHSQDLAGTGWTVGGAGTLVRTDDFLVLGDLHLTRLSTLAGNSLYRAVTLAGGVEAVSLFVEGDGGLAATFGVGLADSGSTTRLDVTVSISAGGVVTAVAATGTVLAVQQSLASSVYRVLLASTAAAAGVGALTICGAPTGTSFIEGGIQVEDAPFPSSYIKTTTAAVTRAKDSLSFPYTAVPQALTILVDFYTEGAASGADRILQIANAGGAAPQLQLYWEAYSGGGRAGAYFENGLGATADTGASAVTAIGDRVELCLQLDATGAMTLIQSLNGGASTSVGPTAAMTLPAAWSGPLVWVAPTSAAFKALRGFKIAAGVRTLAQMRAL